MRKLNFLVFLVSVMFLFNSCGVKRKTSVASANRIPVEGYSARNKSNLKQYYADILGSSPKDLNESLYEYIDDWMGTPHRLGGQTKDGIDCSGFVGMVYQQVYGKTLPRSSRDMAEIVKRKYEKELREGDLVFFSFGGKVIDHVGIYLHNDKFLHVSTKQGVVISNLKDVWYYKYFTRCGTPQN